MIQSTLIFANLVSFVYSQQKLIDISLYEQFKIPKEKIIWTPYSERTYIKLCPNPLVIHHTSSLQSEWIQSISMVFRWLSLSECSFIYIKGLRHFEIWKALNNTIHNGSKWQHFIKINVIVKLLRDNIKFHHSHTSVFTRYGVQNPILHSI